MVKSLKMKKNLLFIAIGLLSAVGLFAQTSGVLTVTTTTDDAGGNYAPRNILAIWVENESGEFVKTLMAYAANRKTHLNIWQASTAAAGSEFNVTDAITGATRPSHSVRECTWNATDFNGNLVSDGTYKLWMELTDKNGTGNYSSFSFLKAEIDTIMTPFNLPSFQNITIHWNPAGVGIFSEPEKAEYSVSNNPGSGIYQIKGKEFDLAQVMTMSGELLFETKSSVIDLSKHTSGMYLIYISRDGKKEAIKLVKQ